MVSEDQDLKLIDRLISEAISARKSAYCKYSGFAVGASLYASNDDGSTMIFTGCNIENASYGASICAERVAADMAVRCGFKNFETIVIVGGNAGEDISGRVYPCGICRQVLAEFGPDMEVIIAESRENYKIFDMSDFMPMRFDLPEK